MKVQFDSLNLHTVAGFPMERVGDRVFYCHYAVNTLDSDGRRVRRVCIQLESVKDIVAPAAWVTGKYS